MRNQKIKDQSLRNLFSNRELSLYVTKGSKFLNNSYLGPKKIMQSNLCRMNNRCIIGYRNRAVFRNFKMTRGILRQYLASGLIPGMKKSSW